MRRRHGLALAVALFVVATATRATARTALGCPGVADPRGDVVFKERITTDWGNVSTDRAAGWTADPLDLLGVAVSADRQYVTTTLHVVAISNDPVHGAVWRVLLEPDVSRPRENIETIARRVTGGDTFQIHHQYQEGTAALGGPGIWDDFVAASGSIDVERGLVHVRIPLTLLDTWHIKRDAKLWGVQGQARSAMGVVVNGVEDWSNMNEGDAWDATANADPHSRLNTPGCPIPG